MKPTTTSHVLRSIFREVGATQMRVTNEGLLDASTLSELVFPETSSESSRFCVDYFSYNLARKRATSSKATTEQMKSALAKWLESERRCRILNDHGRYYTPIGSDKRVFDSLSQRVTRILSDLLCDRWPDFSSLNHTSGSSSNIERKFNWSSSKHDGTPPCHLVDTPISVTCVPAAQDVLSAVLRENLGHARRYERVRNKYVSTFDVDMFEDESIIDSEIESLSAFLCQASPVATFTHVPKDVREVRLIAKSSSLTISLQKMFGDVIRKALFDKGVDLNDQRVNQEWAEIGSLTGIVATVDLSAASDSISLNMLKYFPPRWRDYVLALRDTHVQVTDNGSKHKLAMIAGMGNGYIFELESALFWAFSVAVTEHLNLDTSYVNVYGDDIILPSACVPVLTDFLLYNGFLVNTEKSFWGTDKFRESCGKHYHNGHDVTPVYVKGDLNSNGDVYHLINGLLEWSARTGVSLSNSITLLLNQLKHEDRNVVPITWSSRSGLHAQVDDTCRLPLLKWSKRYQSYSVVYTANEDVVIDVTERCAPSHRITASLVSLERPDLIVQASSLTRASPAILSVFNRLGPLNEVSKSKITWKGEGERKQQRVVPVWDADKATEKRRPKG